MRTDPSVDYWIIALKHATKTAIGLGHVTTQPAERAARPPSQYKLGWGETPFCETPFCYVRLDRMVWKLPREPGPPRHARTCQHSPTCPQRGGKSPSSSASICTTRRQITASASTNQGDWKRRFRFAAALRAAPGPCASPRPSGT
jgi:hypothetical protein